MKQLLKNFLQKLNWYEQLKYSPAFGLYASLFKRAVIREKRRERSFYRSFLSPCPLIFDIGAHDGHKTEAFLSLARKVVACEPDEKNFHTLTVRFRNRRKRVVLEKTALGPVPGKQQMFVHHQGSAFNTLNEKFRQVTEADHLEKWNEKIAFSGVAEVQVLTLDQLIEKYGRPGFIKIDVEGYELQVLKGLSQPVPCLSLECLFPEFRGELQQSLMLLRRLDLQVQFNVSVNERLLWKEFQSHAFLQNFLEYFDQHHFELIVRMPGASTPVP